MNVRPPSTGLGQAAAAVALVLLPAIAAVATPPAAPSSASRALAAWSAPEPMDYGLAMPSRAVAWKAPEPMDYGLGAYATLGHFERAALPTTAVAAR